MKFVDTQRDFSFSHRKEKSLETIVVSRLSRSSSCVFRTLWINSPLSTTRQLFFIYYTPATVKMQLGFRIFLFQLQNPMILRQHAHLLNCNRIELCQPLRLRKAVVDKYCITELIAVQARLNSNYGEFAIIRIGIMDLHTFLTSCMKRSLVCSLLEADRQFLQQSRFREKAI